MVEMRQQRHRRVLLHSISTLVGLAALFAGTLSIVLPEFAGAAETGAKPAETAARPAADPDSFGAMFDQGKTALDEQKLDKAESSFRKALSLAKSRSGDPADVEKSMMKLADTLALRGKTAEAQSTYQRLLTSLIKRYGSSSNQVAPVLVALGSIQESAGNHATAMSYYRKALNINEKNYGPYSPAVAGNLHFLARATAASGDRRTGVQHYKRAISILSKDPSLSASGQMETLMHDYRDLMQKDDDSNRDLIKDFQKDILNKSKSPSIDQIAQAAPAPGSRMAASNLESAWEKQREFQLKATSDYQTDEDPKVVLRGIPQPSSDRALAPAFKVMNDTLFNQKNYGKGEDYYKRLIAVDIDALGPYHPSVANDLNGLARLYISQQRYSDAIPLLARALSIYEQVYGENNLLTTNTCTALAGAEFRAGNTDRAASLYRRALTQSQSSMNPNSMETAKILNELAFLYYHQGKLQESATFYQWALASTEGAVGKNNPLTAACLKDYAKVLRSLGRATDATDIETRADKILAAATTGQGDQPGFSDK